MERVILGFPGRHQDFLPLRTSRQAGSSTGKICGRQKAGTLVKPGGFREELGAGGRVLAGRLGPDSGPQTLGRLRPARPGQSPGGKLGHSQHMRVGFQA